MNFPERYLFKKYPHLTFIIPYKRDRLQVISSIDEGWEHVSVSLLTRCPTWAEMCHVKSIFWNDDEACIQIHPEKVNYVNAHPFCLHIWKPPQEIYSKLFGS